GVGELQQVCEDGASLAQAPAYAGAAPHPLWLFEPSGGNAAEPTDLQPAPRLAESAPPELEAGVRAQARQAQLVACVERTATAPTEVVCQFDLGEDAPFLRAEYRLSLREARTGRVVTSIDLGPGAEGCPAAATVDLLGALVYSKPKPWQYYEAI
nr:hypothetical protein [Micromonospora sp. DSM 115978]